VDSKRYVKSKKNQSVATYKATVSQESNILLSYRHTQQHMKKLCFGENKTIKDMYQSNKRQIAQDFASTREGIGKLQWN